MPCIVTGFVRVDDGPPKRSFSVSHLRELARAVTIVSLTVKTNSTSVGDDRRTAGSDRGIGSPWPATRVLSVCRKHEEKATASPPVNVVRKTPCVDWQSDGECDGTVPCRLASPPDHWWLTHHTPRLKQRGGWQPLRSSTAIAR